MGVATQPMGDSMTVGFSEDHPRITALEYALHWAVQRVIMMSAEPKAAVDDFARHMQGISDSFMRASGGRPLEQQLTAVEIAAALSTLGTDVIGGLPDGVATPSGQR